MNDRLMSAKPSMVRIAFSDPRRADATLGYSHAVDLMRGLAALSVLF